MFIVKRRNSWSVQEQREGRQWWGGCDVMGMGWEGNRSGTAVEEVESRGRYPEMNVSPAMTVVDDE